jgi:MoaA/NifB/PqqE/SkfB family radical SAM enzyme
MTLDQALHLIDQTNDLFLTKNIGFSGGEPFLHYNLLRKLFPYVKDKFDYLMSISTNCFWATSQKKTASILNELKKSGLWSLLISIDDFHLEFIGQRNIENCANIAVGLGIKCFMQTIETNTSHKIDYFKESLDLPEKHELIEWIPIPCDPVGRAKIKVAADELCMTWNPQVGTCSMLRVWISDPYGFIYGCCGTANSDLLIAGNAFKEPLREIVNRANVNPLFNALAAWGGPFLLFRLMVEKGYDHYMKKSYTSACHACHEVLQDQKAIEMILDKLEEIKLDLLMSRLVAHRQIYEYEHKKEKKNIWLPAPNF